MKIYVMRHGPAADDSPSGIDADRELTPAGRERVVRVTEALFSEGEAPLHVVSSPLVRALQTAEIVANLGYARGHRMSVSVRRELALGSYALPLLTKLYESNLRRVLLVGHEPDLTALLGKLLGTAAPEGLAKGAVVGLSVPNDNAAWQTSGRQRFHLDPKTMLFRRTQLVAS
jgi:phosphohistidine phosphatase